MKKVNEVIMRVFDVKPYHYAVYYTVGNPPELIQNEIVYRAWSEDGKQIIWGFEAHNSAAHDPEELVRVVPIAQEQLDKYADWIKTADEEDERKMNNRPKTKKICPYCWGKGIITDGC